MPNEYQTHEHAACGVAVVVNLSRVDASTSTSHNTTLAACEQLEKYTHRSGYNLVTEESDGAGIRFLSLPTEFFQSIMAEFGLPKELELEKDRYAIGHYFLPTDHAELVRAKTCIEQMAQKNHLRIAGWRQVSTNNDMLSETARAKKPAIFQAILLPEENLTSDFESAVSRAAIDIETAAEKEKIQLNILSHSSQSIVYKGMLLPAQVKSFFTDLQNPLFKTRGYIIHSRFATNTDPKWSNAQPCPHAIAHNGEFNSAAANAVEMRASGVIPPRGLSDSMQFDRDIANLIAQKNISLEEAFVRLIPPTPSAQYSLEINNMLRCMMFTRTPYNGPAFVTAYYAGHVIAKLDSVGLRPARFAIIKNKETGERQFRVTSEDDFSRQEFDVIENGQLAPGDMLLVTPDGRLMHTTEILQNICEQYHAKEINFTRIYAEHVKPLESTREAIMAHHPQLSRVLFSAGWDYESQEQVVRYMADHSMERIAAMGDDTNPLYTTGMPPHLSYFFHQLFAQVSAPPLDSIKEREHFTLHTQLGKTFHAETPTALLSLETPVLNPRSYHALQQQSHVRIQELDITFSADISMQAALMQLLKTAEMAAQQNSILILSDQKTDAHHHAIPDLLAIAAVYKHLENQHLLHRVSLIVDSYQITGPHQAAALFAMGAKAIYARGAYEVIHHLYSPPEHMTKENNYQTALEKCLLKTMGKMGITDFNNYANGGLMATLGLDLTVESDAPLTTHPSLAAIFGRLYSPLRGYQLQHIAIAVSDRHRYAFFSNHDFTPLPRSGYYMNEKGGVKHGYGPVVINAFTDWLKAEEVRGILYRMHTILKARGIADFIDERNYSEFTGFLDTTKKIDEKYPEDYLERLVPSSAFIDMCKKIDAYHTAHPTSLHHYFSVKPAAAPAGNPLQRKKEIRERLYSGSMSQGALTEVAHEALTRGMYSVNARSASGEGGEAPLALRTPSQSTFSKQIASGRFGVSAMQILCAGEIEIKIAQGAKPGEGGELPGSKVTIRFAAQRGGLPGLPFVSPPPHHDIYSIEDLEQLIYDIKSVNPNVMVAVKLVASEGIGTIAVGVAKAGADVINIAGNSGGTGAAQQSSIKHAGLPSEIGLREVDAALRKTGLRDLVKLRVSGGLTTAEDVIKTAILGADLFEFGTTAMLTMGCKMQRTCNQSCQPGVATDGHLFKGDQLNTERFFSHLASVIQARLQALNVSSLDELKGRTELLSVIPHPALELYHLAYFTQPYAFANKASREKLAAAKAQKTENLIRATEDAISNKIRDFFARNPDGIFSSEFIHIDTQKRSFGARIAGIFAKYLEDHPRAQIILHTRGNAPQSFGFVLPKGISIVHEGVAQDGCGKSMSGGELILRNTVLGNAACYGASGGKIIVDGSAGNRFGVLLKGAQVIVENIGDLAFEFMTSGTAMIVGRAGAGLANYASGGIIFLHDPDRQIMASESVRDALDDERAAYDFAIQDMLDEYTDKTHSTKSFQLQQFRVLIPKAMDKFNTLRDMIDILKTYQLRQTPFTPGMQVWLEQKILSLLPTACRDDQLALQQITQDDRTPALSPIILAARIAKIKPVLSDRDDIEDIHFAFSPKRASSLVFAKKTVEARLSDVHGELDSSVLNVITHIAVYAQQLTNDAAGCSGCRAQSCAGGDDVKTGCPAGKAIHSINAILKTLGKINTTPTLQQWKILREAFLLQAQSTPFFGYTGAACPAPCQDACTETIPMLTAREKNGKIIGEAVHIKDIEYALFHIGRTMGWFDGKRISPEEKRKLFSNELEYDAYQRMMSPFPFLFSPSSKKSDKKLIIVGSGPAAMQLAYRALRDGFQVSMYEKSDKPGGLLMDGIPAHKFDKAYIAEDFARLKMMGLQLYLNSAVSFDANTQEYRVNGQCVAHAQDENTHVALCLGAGSPKILPASCTQSLTEAQKQKHIISALAFLKAANDIAAIFQNNPALTVEEKNTIIAAHFSHFDPREKNILVIGGGDTAQDVVRWLARYQRNKLHVLSRGPALSETREIIHSYPHSPCAKTAENALRDEEIRHIGGDPRYLVEPVAITISANGQLSITVKTSCFKDEAEIKKHEELKKLHHQLPREHKPLIEMGATHFEHVDLVICALGTEGNRSIPLYDQTQGLPRTTVAGDCAQAESQTIIGAQANANKTYEEKIFPSMCDARFRKSFGFDFFQRVQSVNAPNADAALARRV